jgi:hypothetical protein
MDALKAQLKAFERSFRDEHGREPNKADIKARPDVGASRHWPDSSASLTTCLADMYKSYNRVKASMKASTPIEDPFAASSSAPVASTSRSSTSQVVPAQAAANAYATPKKAAATSRMDLDDAAKVNGHVHGVTYEHANSPARLRQLISKATVSPQRAKSKPLSPIKRAKPLLDGQQDSPRTKARKWLGGSSGLTPKRPRPALLSARSSSRGPSIEPEVEHAMETSPVKPGPNGRAFESIFDDAPATTLSQSKLVFGKKPTPTIVAPEAAPAMSAPAPMRKRPSDGKANGLAVRPAKRAKSVEPGDDAETAMAMDPPAAPAVLPKLFDADEADEPAAPPSPARRRRHRSRAPDESDGSEGNSDLDERPFRHPRDADVVEPVDEDIEPEVLDDEHADLVSTLSLRASPTRKHRLAVAARKARLFAEVLNEPSVRAGKRLGHAAGLEELADLNEEGVGGSGDEAEEEGEDDDWASEPEGWKELGGVEMDGLGETLE